MADKSTAWVLDDDLVASADDVFMPELPGVWRRGEPKTAEELGLSVADVREIVKDTGLPLKETTAKPPDEGWLDDTGGMISGAEYPSAPEAAGKRDASDIPGLTPAEAAERVKWDAEHPSGQTEAMATAVVGDEISGGAPEAQPGSGSAGDKTDEDEG